MGSGNNSLNRIAGSGQSRIVAAGETFEGAMSQFIPREDTVIGTLEEQVIFDGDVESVSVLGDKISLPNGNTDEYGQNIGSKTLVFGEIFVPRYGAFSKITVTSGSVDVYLLLSPQQVNKK